MRGTAHEDSPLTTIQLLKPGILVKGADYAPAEIVGADFVLALGGEVKTLELVPERLLGPELGCRFEKAVAIGPGAVIRALHLRQVDLASVDPGFHVSRSPELGTFPTDR